MTNSEKKFQVLYKIFGRIFLPVLPKKTNWISINQVNLQEFFKNKIKVN